MNTKELRRQRAALIEQARAILNSVPEGQTMTGEQEAQFDRMMADADRLLKTIEAAEKVENLARDLEQPVRGQVLEQDQKPEEVALYRSAIIRWIRSGSEALAAEERDVLSHYRAQSAVTESAGGYTVAQDFYRRIVDAMKAFGGVEEAGAFVIETETGADMPIPTANDTANKGAILAENTASGAQDIAFGQVVLKAYKYTSKTVLVPFELLQDAAVDIESYIARKLGERIGRAINEHFTTGDNDSKPQGVVPFSALGKTGANGQTTSVTYDDLVDLEHALDPAYRRNARWMMHDQTLKAIKKLKDSEGRPLWLPGLAVREPDTILGYPFVVNQDMPQMAASAKSILFGDFSNYWIRRVMGIELFRITDKYIESGQVGFLAFARMDGRGVNAGRNPVVHYANSAT